MQRILLIVCFCACTAFAAETVRVLPETKYPIINVNSIYSWESVRQECLPPKPPEDTVERCTVKKLDDLGSIDDKNFYYVLYEWLDKYESENYGKSNYPTTYPRTNTAVVLFYSDKSAPNMLRPFYADRTDLSVGWFEEPRIIKTSSGSLLQIPHRSFTGANAELDTLLMWKDSGWQLVDTQSWVEDLQSRLPNECTVVRETLVNFEQMKASNYVWRTSDENCCPTCGRFSATLGLEEDRLVIKNLKYDMKARLK
jgi:hypothetical protein